MMKEDGSGFLIPPATCNPQPATPSIVLVHTQMPENIGAAARAMMNFGLRELRLVAPRDGFPCKRAYDLAGHAAPILDNAKMFSTTAEAVADVQRVYAATARMREMVKAVYSPAGASACMAEENIAAAILFGPERTGLANEDVALADRIITIPTASELTSLNIAQSVVVIAYEYCMGGAPPPRTPDNLQHKSEFATKAELQGFFGHLERRLDAADFWKVAEKKPKMWINLQNIFTRASLTEQEVRTLHGVIAALQ
jgi:tRNA/rRNA methyltransferase